MPYMGPVAFEDESPFPKDGYVSWMSQEVSKWMYRKPVSGL